MTKEIITLADLKEDIEFLNREKCGCCHHLINTTDGGRKLCIVVGWLDGFDEAPDGTSNADKTWRICGKIAYQPANSAMQCDFDVDWLFPYYENGEADTTDIEVSGVQSDVDYLNEQANRVWEEWKDTLDTLA